MRLILALDAQNITIDVRKLKAGLSKGKNFDFRFIPQEFWHIPLLPLGEMGQAYFNRLDPLIAAIGRRHRGFELKLNGIWAYPNQNEGRLLWAGVQNAKELRSLQEDFASYFSPLLAEESRDKSFKPHLPLVRLRNHRNVTDLISPYKNASFGNYFLEKITVLEMTSGGAFPVYRRVRDYLLNHPLEEKEPLSSFVP